MFVEDTEQIQNNRDQVFPELAKLKTTAQRVRRKGKVHGKLMTRCYQLHIDNNAPRVIQKHHFVPLDIQQMV